MKRIYLTFGLAAVLLGMGSCEKGFDQLNTNPTAALSLNPVFTFNNAIVSSSYTSENLVWETAIVQQLFSPNSGVLAGANFNITNPSRTGGLWAQYYRNVFRYVVDVVNTTKSDPNRTNLYNMARIWKAYTAMVLTDTYGDIPYSQAGIGYLTGNTSPQYDTQQSIYTDIISELTQAPAALDATKTIETADVLYGGDVTKWKRFANSLLLRVGMRLVKVDPATAQKVVQQAIAANGGLLQSNADNCLIRGDQNYQNPVGVTLNGTEANNYYLTKNFVDYLKTTNDPRLGAIAVRYVGAASGAQQTAARANRDPAVQIGMPLGFDNGTIVAQATKDGLASFYDYSQLDRTRLGKLNSNCYILTYAQTQLLLAEAALRGWTTGAPATYYNAGVTAHMQQMGDYDPNSVIPASAITTYLQQNPYSAANGLAQINTQYWVASFLNGPEGWANFRRTGLPALTPNPYPGKGITGDFFRRLPYPDSEKSVNNTNVQQAISRQGPDTPDTRVWWDKP